MKYILTFSLLCLWANFNPGEETIERRGIVLYPSDIISIGIQEWIEILDRSNLNLIGIHADTKHEPLSVLKDFLGSRKGLQFLRECLDRGIEVEYELHALKDLLPRSLFKTHPEFYRMDADGMRQREFNICFTSEGAYQEIANQIIDITQWLKPTTHRYFFWTDDVQDSFCHCEKCKVYSESEQALLFESRLSEILRKIDKEALVAHLAYHNTLSAPEKVIPLDGVFLEYAPINRNYDKPLSQEHLNSLRANLEIFPAGTAHVLEYWIDASMFSKWNRDSLVKIPWRAAYCQRDVEIYQSLGIRSVTSFGAWINKAYIRQFGKQNTKNMLIEYGDVLSGQ